MVKIYALINSLTDEVFYIGATTQELRFRLSNHISRRTMCFKNKFIYNILKAGGKVEIIELDEVDYYDANFFEEFYIHLFLSYGFTLIQQRKSNYTDCKPLRRSRGTMYDRHVTDMQPIKLH